MSYSYCKISLCNIRPWNLLFKDYLDTQTQGKSCNINMTKYLVTSVIIYCNRTQRFEQGLPPHTLKEWYECVRTQMHQKKKKAELCWYGELSQLKLSALHNYCPSLVMRFILKNPNNSTFPCGCEHLLVLLEFLTMDIIYIVSVTSSTYYYINFKKSISFQPFFPFYYYYFLFNHSLFIYYLISFTNNNRHRKQAFSLLTVLLSDFRCFYSTFFFF